MTLDKHERLISELFIAINEGNQHTVKALINAGAYLNAIDQTGKTPLHHAALEGKADILKLLIEGGANLDQGIIEFTDLGPVMTEYTPLDQAAWHEQYQILELLTAYGADIEVTDKSGNSLLMRAILFGNNKLAAKLISLGANVNAINSIGRTPLHIAVSQSNRELTKLLVEKGAIIMGDHNGITALELGAKTGLDLVISKTYKETIINKTKAVLNRIFRRNNKISQKAFDLAAKNKVSNNTISIDATILEKAKNISAARIIEPLSSKLTDHLATHVIVSQHRTVSREAGK
jgi:ankyrin repeat protein